MSGPHVYVIRSGEQQAVFIKAGEEPARVVGFPIPFPCSITLLAPGHELWSVTPSGYQLARLLVAMILDDGVDLWSAPPCPPLMFGA